MTRTNHPSPVLVDTTQSRCARLRPTPLTAVELTDDFWAPRRQVNQEVTLPSQHQHCEETGRIDNFRRASGKLDVPFQGMFFDDSDVYKCLEALAWTLATDPNPALAQMVETVIAEIADAQEPNGYLNTYFTFDRAAERWTNLRDMHELYCAGHLIQAAIAHHRATTDERLLRVARRLADHVCDVFAKRSGTGGHPEIEMALVELARTTGEIRYRELAQSFLDARGQGLIGGRAYHQDHEPFRQLVQMAGHAVRAVYLNAGAADLYAETGEPALREALDRLWHNMSTRQMYISGGIGSCYLGEAFWKDYYLPNPRAYAESCAAIGSMMWNWRMLALEGATRYADLLELILYNGFLVGVSLDGQTYFYQNPLESDGSHRRQPWFGCACCPPNIARVLASLPAYFYSLSNEGVWVHLYAQGNARLTLADGHPISLNQRTRYPWEGRIEVEVEGGGEFSLRLRVPAWCESGATLALNGRPVAVSLAPGSYAQVQRIWQPGDRLRLDLPMPVRRVVCHPYVAENAGRVALMRGPILYCVEGVDNPGLDPRDFVLPADAGFSTTFHPDLLGGVLVLQAPAQVAPPGEGWADRLYRASDSLSVGPEGRATTLTAIPYYAWANREPGPMQVWLRSG